MVIITKREDNQIKQGNNKETKSENERLAAFVYIPCIFGGLQESQKPRCFM